jgi:hypothetical protein
MLPECVFCILVAKRSRPTPQAPTQGAVFSPSIEIVVWLDIVIHHSAQLHFRLALLRQHGGKWPKVQIQDPITVAEAFGGIVRLVRTYKAAW